MLRNAMSVCLSNLFASALRTASRRGHYPHLAFTCACFTRVFVVQASSFAGRAVYTLGRQSLHSTSSLAGAPGVALDHGAQVQCL